MADKTYTLHGVTAGTPADFIVPGSGASFIAPLARFCNTGAVSGTLTVTRTDASGNVLSNLVPGYELPAKGMFQLPSPKVVNPHKIMVTFTQTTLDCDACGQEG